MIKPNIETMCLGGRGSNNYSIACKLKFLWKEKWGKNLMEGIEKGLWL